MTNTQILEIKEITWQTWRPKIARDFPCMKCHEKIAKFQTKVKLDNLRIVSLAFCEDCTDLLRKQEFDWR